MRWPLKATRFCITLAIVAGADPVSGQTDTGFSFQGQLEQNGAPVNDTCDFRFMLRDAEEGGTQVGPTIFQTLDVRRGHFATTLDFGDEAFSGSSRWLNTAVRCASPCGSVATAADPMYDVGSAAMKPAPFSSWTRRVQTPTKLEQILAECSEGTLTVENGKNCCLAAITGNGGCGAGLYGLSSGDNESAVVGRSEGLRGIGVYGRSVSEYGTGVFGQSQFGSGVRGESHVAGYGGYFVGADGAGAIAADTGVGTVVIQNIGGRPVLDVPTNGLISTGRIETEVLQILGGSDVAEQFEVREAAETVPLPGMVVCIDPEHEGDLVICSKANDQSVAGVISGAGGINTGMLIGQRGSIADGSVPIALSGRVYVLADASEVPILPGDLLATSATPGHVMKASEARDVRGVILGKAMTRLEGGRGLVLVLVNLH